MFFFLDKTRTKKKVFFFQALGHPRHKKMATCSPRLDNPTQTHDQPGSATVVDDTRSQIVFETVEDVFDDDAPCFDDDYDDDYDDDGEPPGLDEEWSNTHSRRNSTDGMRSNSPSRLTDDEAKQNNHEPTIRPSEQPVAPAPTT